MNYKISRTSQYSESLSPCEEAVKGTYIYIDERTVDSPEKIPANKGQTDWWYKDGKNHRVENGHIKRDFIRDGWFIEINSVEDLRKLSDKYGNLIFDSSDNSIEIYDDYRE